jgi:hypothetical protein
MGLARSGSAERPSARSRRKEEAMRDIVDDEQRRSALGLRSQFRKPHAPFGFRRCRGICSVGAPRRCPRIAFVAPPCSCPRGWAACGLQRCCRSSKNSSGAKGSRKNNELRILVAQGSDKILLPALRNKIYYVTFSRNNKPERRQQNVKLFLREPLA